MNRFTAALAFLGLACFVASCGDRDPGTTEASSHDHDHDHDHDHGHDHDHDHDHDHGSGPLEGPTPDAAGGHDHGEMVDLGNFMVGGMRVKADRAGDLVEGTEIIVDIMIDGAPNPEAVRAWVGIESGSGSIKTKLALEGERWHGHLVVPTPLPANAELWVQIEDEDMRSVGHVALGD